MNNNPHGVCMIINNENFTELRKRLGTQKDEGKCVYLNSCVIYIVYELLIYAFRIFITYDGVMM